MSQTKVDHVTPPFGFMGEPSVVSSYEPGSHCAMAPPVVQAPIMPHIVMPHIIMPIMPHIIMPHIILFPHLILPVVPPTTFPVPQFPQQTIPPGQGQQMYPMYSPY
ncbi:hypothetical protein SAMN05444487_106189 [Marininema mesophilum]|uniref:Uncharacterized protein n=1 Tax=Marininema mesophilum TaxID=1048340 RepID=A0A1H2WNJ1_9BACL|nr:hypothetical protein [Marininema mesophilum]SDW82087.1 hypothetical protein SAMN05444487_106189 [Marininema mesophilum]